MPNNVTQTSPESPSDTVQAVQTMTIEIKGQETEALKLALEAVMRLVSGGFIRALIAMKPVSTRFQLTD